MISPKKLPIGTKLTLGSYTLFLGKEDGSPLFAPQIYWELTPEEKKLLGCGPGKWGDLIVPDTFLLSYVGWACKIHDVMYGLGKTDDDKLISDAVFLQNMISIVRTKSWPVLREIRCYDALTYYLAVAEAGNSSFWKGKNKPDQGEAVA